MAHRFRTAKRTTPAAKARAAKYASTEHRQARAAAQQQLQTNGYLVCWRCTRLIHIGNPWHIGHDDTQTNLIRGPEHATCNLKAAARKGNRIQRTTIKRAKQPLQVRRRRLLDL
jgi:hypothetical protein